MPCDTHVRQLSGPGQHLSPIPLPHLNGVLSVVHDIKGSSELQLEKNTIFQVQKEQKYLGILGNKELEHMSEGITLLNGNFCLC